MFFELTKGKNNCVVAKEKQNIRIDKMKIKKPIIKLFDRKLFGCSNHKVPTKSINKI